MRIQNSRSALASDDAPRKVLRSHREVIRDDDIENLRRLARRTVNQFVNSFHHGAHEAGDLVQFKRLLMHEMARTFQIHIEDFFYE